MKIGAMNHPAEDVIGEIRWMGEMGLDFVDLTLEPPRASSHTVNVDAIRRALADFNLDVVGHTAYYLPIASPFEEIRQAALAELRRCIEAFAGVGARVMNIHPDRNIPLHSRSFVIERNIASLRELLPYASAHGIGLMIENLPGEFNTPEQLGELLEPLDDLGMHLDIGHANLLVPANMTEAILMRFGPRLRHVHLHDNKGGYADLHLPLGTGTLNLKEALRALKSHGYDGTITLEVFTPDRRYLAYSRDVLRSAWDVD